MSWIIQSWFLLSLLIVLPAGMTCGWFTTEEWRDATAGQIHPAAMTVVILFLMAFSLDSSRLREAFRTPAPVVWGTVVNIGILPLMTWPIAASFSLPDFGLGLMLAAVVPCTLATASVSTRQAGGNDAVSLLVTLLTNFLSVVLTPYWLRWTIAIEANLDSNAIIYRLALTVLLPTVAGQVLRLATRLAWFAARHRWSIGITAQCLVLVVVGKAAIEAGGRLQSQDTWPPAVEFVGLLCACGGLHAAAMLIAEVGARCFRVRRVDRIATVFAGSQKTLPVGLLLAAMPAVTGGNSLPLITFPILVFHAMQLIMDTAIADLIAKQSTD